MKNDREVATDLAQASELIHAWHDRLVAQAESFEGRTAGLDQALAEARQLEAHLADALGRAEASARDAAKVEARLTEAARQAQTALPPLEATRHEAEALFRQQITSLQAAEAQAAQVSARVAEVAATTEALQANLFQAEALRAELQAQAGLAEVTGTLCHRTQAAIETWQAEAEAREERLRADVEAREDRLRELEARLQAQQGGWRRWGPLAAATAVFTLLLALAPLTAPLRASYAVQAAQGALTAALDEPDQETRWRLARRAIAQAEEALATDRSCATAHLVLARVYQEVYRDSALALRELTLAQALAERQRDTRSAEEAERLRSAISARPTQDPTPPVPAPPLSAEALASLARDVGMAEFGEALSLNNLDHWRRHIGSAEQAFRLSLTFRPAYAEARYNLAVALGEQGRVADAQAQLAWAHHTDGGLDSPLCASISKLEQKLGGKAEHGAGGGN